jgi:hypothetical protein
MALDQGAKTRFIEGMVEDFQKELPKELKGEQLELALEGQRKYATNLCRRIVDLVQEGRIRNVASGDVSRRLE